MAERRELTIDDVRTATHFSRKHLEERIEQAERAYGDLDRAKREEAKLCRFCFYRGPNMAGQAFTNRDCAGCGGAQSFPTTDTLRVCAACSDRLHVCRRCVADLDLVDRRKLERRR